MHALLQAASAWVSPPEPAPALTPAERTVIVSALAGDETAFAELIRLFSLKLFPIALGILQHSGEAEDVVQEVFCKVYRQRRDLRDPEKFPAWLYTIARNTARAKFRYRPPHPVQLTPSEEGDGINLLPDEKMAPPDTALTRGERDRVLHAALARLPEQHRIALTLRYLEGHDHQEIERTLGVSNGTLRGILARSLAVLRRDLSAFILAPEKTV